jgi:hypothetical protein
MRFPAIFGASVFLLLCASSATAQVLELPPRPYRGLFGGGPPPDPNRARQDLKVSGNVLGGYDDNLTPPSGSVVGQSYPAGYTAFSDAALHYSYGNIDHFFSVGGRGFMNTYRNIGIGPSYGGEQSLHGRTGAGRRVDLQLDETLNYAPYFSLGLFGPVQGVPAHSDPDANPTNGLKQTSSWTTRAGGTMNYRWTRSTKTDVGYTFNRVKYVDAAAFDGRTQSVTAGLEHMVSRAVAIRFGVVGNDAQYVQPDGASTSIRDQSVDAGFRFTRRVSRTRQLSVSGGAGAVRTRTLSPFTREALTFVTPSGYASARLDFARSWNLAGDYRRTVSAPQGAAPQAFISDAALITSGGYPTRWLETVVSFGYSNGVTGGTADGVEPGRYDAYTGTAQIRFRLTRFWSALVSGSRYQYTLNGVASESLRVAPRLDRNSLRVGISWQLPLYGSYVDTPDRAAGKD